MSCKPDGDIWYTNRFPRWVQRRLEQKDCVVSEVEYGPVSIYEPCVWKYVNPFMVIIYDLKEDSIYKIEVKR